jgi:hypothetical protein
MLHLLGNRLQKTHRQVNKQLNHLQVSRQTTHQANRQRNLHQESKCSRHHHQVSKNWKNHRQASRMTNRCFQESRQLNHLLGCRLLRSRHQGNKCSTIRDQKYSALTCSCQQASQRQKKVEVRTNIVVGF